MDGATGSTESTASAIFAIHSATVESATFSIASASATFALALAFAGSAYDSFASESWRNPYLYIMELDMQLNLENKLYLDLGLQVLLLMLLIVLNLLLLEPYLRRTLHLRLLLDMCLEPLL